MEEMQATEATEVSEVTTTDEGLFDGWSDEPATSEEETVEESTEEATEEPEAEVTEEVEEAEEAETLEEGLNYGDIEVKFLKENKKLSDFEPEEVAKLFQKGQNHDRIQEQLSPLKELAEHYEIDIKTMTEMLYNDYFKMQAKKNNTTEAIERKTYELDNRDRKDKLARELNEQTAKEAEMKSKSKESMLKEFNNLYSDVKADEIPNEVWERVDKGSNLVDAYARYENSQLKTQLLKLTKQLENKAKAPVKGSKQGDVLANNNDPMFDGWD